MTLTFSPREGEHIRDAGGRGHTLRDEIAAYDDGTVARVRVLRVPSSPRFQECLKYAFHYGEAGGPKPIIRFDNHHGGHELHIAGTGYDIQFPGLGPLYRAWRAVLPTDKRREW
jgi:hypothetical protein